MQIIFHDTVCIAILMRNMEQSNSINFGARESKLFRVIWALLCIFIIIYFELK